MKRIFCAVALLFSTAIMQSSYDVRNFDRKIDQGIERSDTVVSTPGTIDMSYGTNGALDLTSSPILLPTGQAWAINVITTGAQAGNILVADSTGTDTTIAMLNATGTGLVLNAFCPGVSVPYSYRNCQALPLSRLMRRHQIIIFSAATDQSII
jgi:hypothetical protein